MSREAVFAGIRAALNTVPTGGTPMLAPAQPTTQTASLARFIERATLHACTHERIATLDELPSRALAWLESRAPIATLWMAAPLARLPWPDTLTRRCDAARKDTVAAVSLAFAGIAESGTLVMASGPDSPITHNFVPEFHVITLHLADLVANQEAVWARLRALGTLPRALNLVAGPSRTGDVEQTIQIGAHGPRAVHVVLVG
ncbi:lactate utilization protein [Niveibacterium umoris]|uniref:L-lactate dehydrogenase complex protein LldG n=1 Tax=Niveibacterium umoris TaxID=1193620 RepID=A0A840BM20_9RHOO|nr:LUD domain-containing protein [Niveibacterium umoris]MBB4014275.1 L-lactate dehydrogenase complex protein LldG [Niveibacterium umoris]